MTQHRVYRSEFAAYAVWTGIFSLPILALAQVLRTLGWEGFLARDMLLPLLLCVGLVVATCAWLASYRLTLSDTSISYRSWRKSWSARRSEVDRIEASRVAPISGLPVGAYVHFKDGRRELIYTKMFSRAAAYDLLGYGSAV